MLFENKSHDIEIRKWNSYNFPYHLHNNIEILICTNGSFDVFCNDREMILNRGDVMVAFPGDMHAYKATSYGEGIMIIFDSNISSVISELISNVEYENFIKEKHIISLAEDMLYHYTNNSNFTIIYGYLHTIVGMSVKKAKTHKKQYEMSTLHSVIRYIAFNYTNQITLKSVSKYIGISQSHLSRIFSQKIDGGFKHYVNLLRVEKAKDLLKNTNNSISEIMFEAGFVDQGTFNRVFKQNTNCTPKEYRKNETCLHSISSAKMMI